MVAEEVVERIRAYQESCRDIEKEREKGALTAADYEEYNRQIDKTLRGLREQVQRQETALREPHERLSQTRRAIQAYKSLLSDGEPQLPAPDSPLNGLLAIREARRLVQEFKHTIPSTAEQLVRDRERLKAEEADLQDANAITTELQRRIRDIRQNGRDENDTGRKKSRQDLNRAAKEQIREHRRKGVEIDEKTAELQNALKEFIEEHLAPMLAAEDIGGPVVGDQVEVSDSTLEAGYTTRGKERKASRVSSGQSTGNKKQQQRIDELIHRGKRGGQPSGRDGENGDDNEEDVTRINNPREAAAQEMQSLLDSLLSIATTSSYVELDQDSAASRFLVKAKIAQFHPRDSQKLRLIDVAREIAD
ncbi:uncharacterized protein ARB_04980 [Trichophyton benhamiae CBS 112371]|uniref:Uncharacterized protein n=1 Tax=Arthroderma benhamiae (strain ATCC MYA-4681 / CBS 112371) TaxID=663331 RepID=D4AKY4_ARTBC|nr:uncharacterized protein ARB_04980 [Trichophyton benhamiae CBS 112371]EFE36043.1 conserved hypothetical protein [Trichophyton benhamiae CBS 112371]